MSIFAFADNSPVDGSMPNQVQPIGVASTAGGTQAKAVYKNWHIGSNNATNWDAALRAAASAGQGFDVAVVLTDGNPTVSGVNPTQGPRSYNRISEVEAAVFSANLLKSLGTRVISVGVGTGVSGTFTPLNLAAISGPIKYNGANAHSRGLFPDDELRRSRGGPARRRARRVPGSAGGGQADRGLERQHRQ